MSKKAELDYSKFLMDIIDHLPLILFCKDYRQEGKGQFIAWNKTAEEIWGLKKEAVLGKTDHDFFPKEQADFFVQKDMETLKSGELVYIDQEPIKSPSKGDMVVRTWKVPIDNKFILGISQDISHQVLLEKEVKKQEEMLARSARLASLGEMSGGLAHEINNPLGIIKLASQTLMKSLKDHENPRVAESAELITTSVDRISKITTGLLKFARFGEGHEKTNLRVVDVIMDTLSFCEEKMRSESIQFEKEIDENLIIKGNSTEIVQVLVNILNNAIYASKQNKPSWVKLTSKEDKDFIKILVSDSGNGFTKEETSDKIFDPFYTTKPIGVGTGLGLSISQGIMNDHGGKIDFDFSKGVTTCVLSFPKKS